MSAYTRLHASRPAVAGYSILEQAVSLSVIALVLGSILVPLQTQIETRKNDETRRLVESAQEMLLGFAAANGYFPCPADTASSGQEAAGSNHATGACPTYNGYLPAALLGFKPTDAEGYAVDAWESKANRIRYAVADQAIAGVPNAFTRANGMRDVPLSSLGAVPLLHICQSGSGTNPNDCGSAVTLASNAAIVVWSAGANAAVGGGSVHEAQNPNPNGGSVDRVFVSRLVLAGQFTPAAQSAASPPGAR
jgi:type II secretory pathway pseudopilin PulG